MKYRHLVKQIKREWRTENMQILSVVILTTAADNLLQNLIHLSLSEYLYKTMTRQKDVLLGHSIFRGDTAAFHLFFF